MRGSDPLALIVDDAPDTRAVLRALATKRGYRTMEAGDGVEAIDAVKAARPDLILLDISMPRMDGLTALAEIRDIDPQVSVVIVSAKSDRDSIEEALALGAINFVHKPFDTDELSFVLDRVYRVIEEEADIQDVLSVIEQRDTKISFLGRPEMLSKVVSYLGRELVNHYPGHDVPSTEIKLALYESLANAFEHGNLEVTFEQKTEAMAAPGGMEKMLKERLGTPELSSRKIHVLARYMDGAAEFRVRDEGPGFDPKATLAKPMADTSALHGRGITLIRHYMDSVSWNDAGNEIVMSIAIKATAAPMA